MSWKEYEFEIPLGIEIPEEKVTEREDWLEDCEPDDVFELKPECFTTKNRYDAALQLCRTCGGWFYFENEEERDKRAELLRRIFLAEKGDPISYYVVSEGGIDYIGAIRDNNGKYRGKLYGIDSLWSLANSLGERSSLEKAECLEWLIDFFGDELKYDPRGEVQRVFLGGHSGDLELMLAMKPSLIRKLTEKSLPIDTDDLGRVSSAAAGLIRYGRNTEGLDLYRSVFSCAKERKTGRSVKQTIVDEFLERLARGYEDEPYLSEEAVSAVEEQLEEFTDPEYVAKIRKTINRNRL